MSPVNSNGLDLMPTKKHPNDKKRKAFKAALALSGTTLTKWAEQQGVTPEHLWTVLSGRRDSARLLNEVDAFIAKHLEKLGAA